MDQPRTKRSRWKLALLIGGGAVVVLGFAIVGILLHIASTARDRAVEAIQQRFKGKVELGSLTLSLRAGPQATGDDLKIWLQGRSDGPPFISIRRFSFDAGIAGLLRKPVRIRAVKLEGLEIHIARKPETDEKAPEEKKHRSDGENRPKYPFVIEHIEADGALLRILPKNPAKDPLVFELSELRMESVGIDQPMKFHTLLTNDTPPGLIHSTGDFGPWRVDDPGLTPVSGEYIFREADLSVFRGVSGILSSEGSYDGVLQRIQVRGQTDVPDFRVSKGGKPVHMTTRFEAVVDGTNGDTLLQPVEASFLKTKLIARGGITKRPGQKGKTVSLEVTVDNGRIEDILHLVLKAEAPLTGALKMKTAFEIPPGNKDVIEKLQLKGKLQIDATRFTSVNIQEKLATLSRRSRGKSEEQASASVASNLLCDFVLADSAANFSLVSFSVPGALVDLIGFYQLDRENLDFRGHLKMDAKLSQTTTGWKSILLKPVDPFFRKDGYGAVIPIKVTGTRDQPKWGLNLGGGKPGQ